jgi:cytoskeletal protein CcmA (bactofilin family)
MTIDGRIEGTIEVHDHSVTIGPTAEIHADIAAKTVTVRGNVKGTISATELVDIRETGSIEGDIVSPRVSMVEGSVVRGKIDTLSQHLKAPAKNPQAHQPVAG